MLTLLGNRRFAPLFWCQFFAAFNDNALKTGLVMVALRQDGPSAGPVITLAGGIFILPFFLLSGLGGEWADRSDKTRLARRLKAVEAVPALVAALGFMLHAIPVLFLALAGFGVLAALFGPVKYAILPDLVPSSALPAANALVEFATFLAILLGTLAGGVAADHAGVLSTFVVMLFAALAWIAACWLPPVPAAAPDLAARANIFASTAALLRDLRADPALWRAGMIAAWFWLVGSVVLAMLPPWVTAHWHGSQRDVTMCLALFCTGIGLGSALAARCCHDRPRLGLCALGTASMAGILLLLAALPPDSAGPPWHAMVLLLLLAAAGGLVAVPAATALQIWSGPGRRARTVAGANVLSAGAMVLGAAVVAPAQHCGVGGGAVLFWLGIANLPVAGWMVWHRSSAVRVPR